MKLRLIVDARASNLHFQNPPGVVMAGPEVFANMEVAHTGQLFIAETDIDNCFYRLRIDENYGRYFSLPGVKASDFGITHVAGDLVGPDERIYPCLAVLPMGHTWSLYYAQNVSEHQTSSVPDLAGCRPMRGDGSSSVLADPSELTYFVYVDNIGVIGSDPVRVEEAVRSVASQLTGLGLLCHAPSPASTVADVLGVEFNSERCGFRPTAKRYGLIRRTIEWVLRRGRLSGQQLEILVGHMTYFCMLQRGALSIFNSVYKFIRTAGARTLPLWQSVAEELRVFRSLMPLVNSRWDLPWDCTVLCYDSCEDGRGVVQGKWPLPWVVGAGRNSERSRFKRMVGGIMPRQAAMRMMDPFSDPLTVVSKVPAEPVSGSLWTSRADFPEVQADHIAATTWRVVVSKRWKSRPITHEGEARAGVAAAVCAATWQATCFADVYKSETTWGWC
jgi:hypothetical protein